MNRPFLIVALIAALSSFAFGQDIRGQQSNDLCDRFAMRVVKPAENIDPKMVLQFDTNADQAMVKNPCRPAQLLVERAKPVLPELPQQQTSGTPSLKFQLPEGRVKSPAEVLKQFAAPKPNRN